MVAESKFAAALITRPRYGHVCVSHSVTARERVRTLALAMVRVVFLELAIVCCSNTSFSAKTVTANIPLACVTTSVLAYSNPVPLKTS